MTKLVVGGVDRACRRGQRSIVALIMVRTAPSMDGREESPQTIAVEGLEWGLDMDEVNQGRWKSSFQKRWLDAND